MKNTSKDFYIDTERSKIQPPQKKKEKKEKAKKEKKKSRKRERVLPKENLDLWGKGGVNKSIKPKKNFETIKIRDVHPGQSYNPVKEELFHAYVTAREKEDLAKRKRKKKPIVDPMDISGGDDVLDGIAAERGDFENIYNIPDIFVKEGEEDFEKKKKKKKVKKSTRKTRQKKKKKANNDSKKGKKSVEDIVKEVDLEIKKDKETKKRKELKRKREEEKLKNLEVEAIQSLKDIDLKGSSLQQLSMMSGEKLFNEQVKKHKIALVPVRKRRKMHAI